MVNLNKNNNGPKENVDNANVSKQTEVTGNFTNIVYAMLTHGILSLTTYLINNLCFDAFGTSPTCIVALFFIFFGPIGAMFIVRGVYWLFPVWSDEVRNFFAATCYIIAGMMMLIAPAFLNASCFNGFLSEIPISPLILEIELSLSYIIQLILMMVL